MRDGWRGRRHALRDLLAQSKDETADDFSKRRAAQRACQQLILPRAGVEGVAYFRKRMSLMAALARSLGRAKVPLVRRVWARRERNDARPRARRIHACAVCARTRATAD